MSYDYLIQNLKSLKSIEPEKEFTERSRRLVLLSPQKHRYVFHFKNGVTNLFRVSLALGLMCLMLLVASGKLAPKHNLFIASLNNKNLIKEGLGADFNIQLAEVKYYKETVKQITLALNEIINNDSNPEIPYLLREKNNINHANP